MDLLLRWAALSVAIWLTARILPGFQVRDAKSAVLIAAVLGVLHFFVGKVLFFLIGIGTLGLGFLLGFVTRWLVTALLLSLTDSLMDSLTLKNFRTALLGAALMTVLSTLAGSLANLLF